MNHACLLCHDSWLTSKSPSSSSEKKPAAGRDAKTPIPTWSWRTGRAVAGSLLRCPCQAQGPEGRGRQRSYSSPDSRLQHPDSLFCSLSSLYTFFCASLSFLAPRFPQRTRFLVPWSFSVLSSVFYCGSTPAQNWTPADAFPTLTISVGYKNYFVYLTGSFPVCI